MNGDIDVSTFLQNEEKILFYGFRLHNDSQLFYLVCIFQKILARIESENQQ